MRAGCSAFFAKQPHQSVKDKYPIANASVVSEENISRAPKMDDVRQERIQYNPAYPIRFLVCSSLKSSAALTARRAGPGIQNHLLPFALGANVSGQIGSVLAGGLLLSYLLPHVNNVMNVVSAFNG